jgi:perosamine synthetase
MLVTDDDAIRARALFLRDHGRPPGDRLFHNIEVAYKYKMSSMQAALGTAQLERVEELISRKREIFGWYADELMGLPGVTLNYEAPGTKNTYWMVTAALAPALGQRKERLMALLAAEGIDCRPFFHPLSSLPAYAGSAQAQAARVRNSVSYALSPFAINLPSALNLTQGQVRRVANALRAVLMPARPL